MAALAPSSDVLPAPAVKPSRGLRLVCAALIVFAVALAWSNSLAGPFVLDDLPAITENASIRGWRTAFSPPNDGQTVTGRPLVNLSFALNHALAAPDPHAIKNMLTGRDGDAVLGYHLLNLAIHAAAALVLFGLVWRTLSGSVLGKYFRSDDPASAQTSVFLALIVALLWAVHPLQTGAVTYIAQRAEALCALFYLLTLWFLRCGSESARPRRWLVAGVLACAGGMASKEVMVSAPLMALLYDRTFIAGSFAEAWRRRWAFYAGLAATWILLGALVLHSGNRGATAGFPIESAGAITPWTYLLRQCEAIVQYLRLAVWPDRLVSDYGYGVVADPWQVWPQGLALLGILAATLWALWRRPVWGFLGTWFFAVLAPSSSFIPVVTETAAEHRMYLPLAACAVAAVVGIYWMARRGGRAGLIGAAVIGAVAIIALGVATHRRNRFYQSARMLWKDAVAKQPANARAHQELALALAREKNYEAAVAEYRNAIRLLPNYPMAHNNFGSALAEMGRFAEAAQEYAEAVRLRPDLGEAYFGLGNMLANLGRISDAILCFQRAVELRPGLIIAQNNLARALGSVGRKAEAEAVFQRLMREHPEQAQVQFEFANFLGNTGRTAEAIVHYREVIRLNQDFADAYVNLGIVLIRSGQRAEGLAMLQAAELRARNNPAVLAKIEQARNSPQP